MFPNMDAGYANNLWKEKLTKPIKEQTRTDVDVEKLESSDD